MLMSKTCNPAYIEICNKRLDAVQPKLELTV